MPESDRPPTREEEQEATGRVVAYLTAELSDQSDSEQILVLLTRELQSLSRRHLVQTCLAALTFGQLALENWASLEVESQSDDPTEEQVSQQAQMQLEQLAIEIAAIYAGGEDGDPPES